MSEKSMEDRVREAIRSCNGERLDTPARRSDRDTTIIAGNIIGSNNNLIARNGVVSVLEKTHQSTTDNNLPMLIH